MPVRQVFVLLKNSEALGDEAAHSKSLVFSARGQNTQFLESIKGVE